MTIDIQGWTTEPGLVPIEVPRHFRALYDLAASEWIQQVRARPGDPTLIAEARSASGTAIWSDTAGVVTFLYPNDNEHLVGSHVHDYGFVPPGGAFIRVDGGAFSIHRGVIR